MIKHAFRQRTCLESASSWVSFADPVCLQVSLDKYRCSKYVRKVGRSLLGVTLMSLLEVSSDVFFVFFVCRSHLMYTGLFLYIYVSFDSCVSPWRRRKGESTSRKSVGLFQGSLFIFTGLF